MRIRHLLALLVVLCCGVCTRLGGSTGPDDRPLTDPKSVVSLSNSAARPAPIDDLYYTRSVFGTLLPDKNFVIVASQLLDHRILILMSSERFWIRFHPDLD
jgi:hypothetical protein